MRREAMGKEKWVHLFQSIGLDDEAMERWHKAFEVNYPQDHQSFLEWLGIPKEEIEAIRSSC